MKEGISTSSLPITLPESVYIRLSEAFGSEEVSDCPWITLSLIHSSFLNEGEADFDALNISSATLWLLNELSKSVTKLALVHLAYEMRDKKSPYDICNFESRYHQNIYTKVAEKFHLIDAEFIGKGYNEDIKKSKKAESALISRLGSQFLGAGNFLLFSQKKYLSNISNVLRQISIPEHFFLSNSGEKF